MYNNPTPRFHSGRRFSLKSLPEGGEGSENSVGVLDSYPYNEQAFTTKASRAVIA